MASHAKRPCLENGFQDEEATSSAMDKEYFKSYSDVHVHEEMLADLVRTNTYRKAILKNYDLIRGKVVADIGAGTGILSMFCVQAGAKAVYAVEASDMAHQITAVVKENNMEDIITVIHSKAEDVELPEQVDVIVSEWMGYMLLYETMLPSILLARNKWLKQSGVMFPGKASLHMAPLSDEAYEERLDFWHDMKDFYKVSMTAMIPFAQKSIARCVCVKAVLPEGIQAHAQTICAFDLHSASLHAVKHVQKNFNFCCFGHSRIHGFVTWFDVEFPQGIKLSTSPYAQETHWQQCVMYIDEPFQVQQDTVIKGSIEISPNSKKPRFLDIHLTYKVGENKTVHKYYYMNDSIT